MLKLRLLQLTAVAPPLFPRQPIAANSFSITPHQPLLPNPSLHSSPHSCLRLCASRRVSDFPQGGGGDLVGGARNWSRAIESVYGGRREEYDGEDGSDEEEDRSLDLLVRFVQNVFRKVSRRARKAVRSVLPVPISTQLVSFAVNGVLILAFLWVLKAFLEALLLCRKNDEICNILLYIAYNEKSTTSNMNINSSMVYYMQRVVCTLGSVVFVSILLIRGVWSGVTYMQENRSYRMNEADDDHRAWTRAQPVT